MDNNDNTMKPSAKNYYLEANDRNAILTSRHKRIPSYALWRDIDIEKETIDTRISWWKNYETNNILVISSLATQWITALKQASDC